MQIDSGDNIEVRCILDREQLTNQTHSLTHFHMYGEQKEKYALCRK